MTLANQISLTLFREHNAYSAAEGLAALIMQLIPEGARATAEKELRAAADFIHEVEYTFYEHDERKPAARAMAKNRASYTITILATISSEPVKIRRLLRKFFRQVNTYSRLGEKIADWVACTDSDFSNVFDHVYGDFFKRNYPQPDGAI